MTHQNPYDMTELAADRIKTIHHDVKQMGGAGKGEANVLVRLLSTAIVLGAALSLMYLSTQRPETDDHLLIKKRWPHLWGFLSGPRRRRGG